MNRRSRDCLRFAQAQCKDCRLLVSQPQASDEEIEKYYRCMYYEQKWPDPELVWKTNQRLYYRYELALMRKLWSQWPPPDFAETVEIGCGYGLMLEILQNLGYGTQGLDPNATAVAHCNSRRLKAIVGQSPGFPWPPSSVDLAPAMQVIEHMRDPLGFLGELVSLVKPGGVIVITTEDALASQYFAARIGARLLGRVPRFQTSTDHTFVFRAEHLNKMLLQAGCDEVRTQRYSHVPERESLHWKAYKGLFRSVDRTLRHGEYLIAVGRRAARQMQLRWWTSRGCQIGTLTTHSVGDV